MDRLAAKRSSRRSPAPDTQLGLRLKQLRLSKGLTQTELAGDRFSKEYLSQIERGKTRPTAETIAWLAARLGVDVEQLANGVPTDLHRQVEAALAVGDAYLQKHDYAPASEEYARAKQLVTGANFPELEVRALLGEAHTRVVLGDAKVGLELAGAAREIVENPEHKGRFTDLDLAEVMHYMGVSRYMLGSVTTALGFFNEALRLAARQERQDRREDRPSTPRLELTIRVLHYRSRCYRHRRDYDAARVDINRAIDLSALIEDESRLGDLYFQASLVAYKEGRWVKARSLAIQAKECLERASREGEIGKLLNNLGGLNLLLGNPDAAEKYLTEAFAKALEVDDSGDAGQAISSLARVNLDRKDYPKAAEQALVALTFLRGRTDFLVETAMAQITLGRALLNLNRLSLAERVLSLAADTFERGESKSHRALAWVAQGELAETRGDAREAARLYRKAADELQDENF
jgi:transcriptional regulator with XRE-family HTH domain